MHVIVFASGDESSPNQGTPMPPPIERTVFATPNLRAGQFRCPIDFPRFADTGPADGYLIVFPRTSVQITHSGQRPVVADPNVVMFYNHRQEYRRAALSERGDNCEWFAFSATIAAEAAQLHNPALADRPERPFELSHGPSPAPTFLLQRRLMQQLTSAAPPAALLVEECMLYVLGEALAEAYRVAGLRGRRAVRGGLRAGAELVYNLKAVLAQRFHEPVTLAELAQAVYCSPFHLCRVFRAHTGQTIHAYLNQLRLRTALELVAQGVSDLTALGVGLGFASHSHFTREFRRTFGTTPSALRRAGSPQLLRELSKNMIA